MFGDGSQTRSFCYVDDLIRGIVALAESDVHSPVNIGNPNEFTLLELAKAVIEVTDSRSEIVYEALPTDDPQVSASPTSAAPATCSAGSRRSSCARACAARSSRPASSASSAPRTEPHSSAVPLPGMWAKEQRTQKGRRCGRPFRCIDGAFRLLGVRGEGHRPERVARDEVRAGPAGTDR